MKSCFKNASCPPHGSQDLRLRWFGGGFQLWSSVSQELPHIIDAAHPREPDLGHSCLPSGREFKGKVQDSKKDFRVSLEGGNLRGNQANPNPFPCGHQGTLPTLPGFGCTRIVISQSLSNIYFTLMLFVYISLSFLSSFLWNSTLS